MKHCTLCGEDKPLSAFGTDKSRPDGHYYSCNDCRRAKANARYHRGKRNLETVGERQWNAPDAEYVLRKCLRCRSPFQTANDYRMCSGCRAHDEQSRRPLTFSCGAV